MQLIAIQIVQKKNVFDMPPFQRKEYVSVEHISSPFTKRENRFWHLRNDKNGNVYTHRELKSYWTFCFTNEQWSNITPPSGITKSCKSFP